MSTFTLISLGVVIPLIVALIDALRLHRLALSKAHDMMLYSLCKVRDETAMLAIEGKLSENDEVFDFFYTTTARVVHDNKQMGVCFNGLMRALDKELSLSSNDSRQTNALKTRVQSGDEKIKELASNWAFAIELGFMASFPLIKYDRVVRILRKFHSDSLQSLMRLVGFSNEELKVLSFCRSLRAI